jgi:serine O-acetyltransferase
MYHGVTLGGVTWDKVKRHPTIGDNVVIGSGAKVLGPFTVGENSKIGSNSVVVKEVPPNSSVVGIPGRVVMTEDKPAEKPDLQHGNMPDPEAKAISCLFDQIRELDRKYQALLSEQEELKKKISG